MNDKVFFAKALLPNGWGDNVLAEIGPDGRYLSIEPNASRGKAPVFNGICVPGLSNLHSHAFQRAMAGLAEIAGPGDDNFWSWRKVMYRFLENLHPEDLEAIATQLYVELLKGGYTRVAEFHYLHHQPDGTPYDNLTEMSERIMAAAQNSGIALTLLPVLYGNGGFGGKAIRQEQQRFFNPADRFLTLVEALSAIITSHPHFKLGIAPHSLRAVTDDLLRDVLDGLPEQIAHGPVHIHISEQIKEVEDSVAWSGRRPIEHLYEHFDVDDRWCLVHATHTTPAEINLIAQSGAVAGLCPTTEANLGDGLFRAVEFAKSDGAFGVGSDSNISTSLCDELRTLEYGLRLTNQKRNILCAGENSSGGRWLFDRALFGGARACGVRAGITIGADADFIVLDDQHPAIAGRRGDQILDSWIFFNGGSPIRQVVVGGRHVVEDGAHISEDIISERFRETMRRLMDGV